MLPQRLNGVDQSSCLMYCSQNIVRIYNINEVIYEFLFQNAIGQNIPCYSLNYEPTNEICEMYGEQTRNESDSATLAIDDEHNFGDKFCIKSLSLFISSISILFFQQNITVMQRHCIRYIFTRNS